MPQQNDILEQAELLTNMDELSDIDIENISYAEMSLAEDENEFKKKMKIKYKLKNSFNDYSSKVSWPVFFAVCLFTLGAWLDINAIWSELVYLVDELPESWQLPSILNLISVLAQTGPLCFTVGHYFFPKVFTFVRAIYFIFTVGLLSCFFLALFWSKTAVLFHESRSIFLYIFNFTLSILDGTSSLTFLPYIGGYFSKEYIIPNYIGESMSSLLPGIFAIFQNIGVKDECLAIIIPKNTTLFYINMTYLHSNNNISSLISDSINKIPLLKSKKLEPNYPVSVYFLIMVFLLMVSTLAFTFLHFSTTARRARKPIKNDQKITYRFSENQMNISQVDLILDEYNSNNEISRDTIIKKANSKETCVLMFITFCVSFVQYGYLPGLLSYSTIPYGNKYFNLSVNLSACLQPFAIFLSIWSYEVPTKQIIYEFCFNSIFATFILIVSVMSPCPPFINYWFGGILVVFSWVMCTCMSLRIRLLAATSLEKDGQNMLFLLGLATMFGQMVGGSLSFVSIDIYHIFKDKQKCIENVCG